MVPGLKYIPIFRSKNEEIAVIKHFDFGNSIIPYLEIIKEVPSPPRETKKNGVVKPAKPVTIDDFRVQYSKVISQVNSPHIFIDIPTHVNTARASPNIKEFLVRVATNMMLKVQYLQTLVRIDNKVIPVISTFFKHGDINSLVTQYNLLKDVFPVIGLRTSVKTFNQEIAQIIQVANKEDFLFMDWDEENIEIEEPDFNEIVENLKKLKCRNVHLRCPIPRSLSNVSLQHDKRIDKINNRHIINYKDYGASVFSDYAGIKKGELSDGGLISPGFIYYDAVNNEYYGFRFKHGNHKNIAEYPKLDEFEDTIVPDIIRCSATERMRTDSNGYLHDNNRGWKTILRIAQGEESGKSQGKFKSIAMNHYLWCMQRKIENKK